MISIGVDIGNNGAIAVLSDSVAIIRIVDMPTQTMVKGNKTKTFLDEVAFRNVFRSYVNIDDVYILIEAVHSMPKDGGSSGFSFGTSFGLCRGIIVGLGLKYSLISPQKWKKHFGLTGKEKKASCDKALSLYPDHEFYTKRGRALDGRGDAVLIATYGLTKL